MSKIYTDLNTVLTPYATAIKKNASDITSLNGSLGDVKADLDALEPGLSDEAKEALLACFKHVAWIDDDGQTYYEALEETLNRSHTPGDVLYSLPSATTFNGTSTYIDTGLQLMKSEKSNITIVFDAIDNHPVGQSAVILHCMHENDPYPGICIQEWNDSGRLYAFDVNSNSASGIIRFPSHSTNIGVRVKAVVIINFTSKTSKVIANIGGTDYTNSAQLPSDVNDVNISENALLGCYQDASGTKGRYWKGTIYDFKIYDYAWTDTEAQAYLQEEHS